MSRKFQSLFLLRGLNKFHEMRQFHSFNSINLNVNSDKFVASKFRVNAFRTMSSDSGATVRKVIQSKCGPEPVGPYNQAIMFGNIVYLSGVLGLERGKKELVEGGTAAQAKQALINMGHILKAAGSSYENVIKTTIFLANIEDFSDVNDVYKEFFTANFPARSTFQVAKLPLDALVEIEAIAGTGKVKQESCNCGK